MSQYNANPSKKNAAQESVTTRALSCGAASFNGQVSGTRASFSGPISSASFSTGALSGTTLAVSGSSTLSGAVTASGGATLTGGASVDTLTIGGSAPWLPSNSLRAWGTITDSNAYNNGGSTGIALVGAYPSGMSVARHAAKAGQYDITIPSEIVTGTNYLVLVSPQPTTYQTGDFGSPIGTSSAIIGVGIPNTATSFAVLTISLSSATLYNAPRTSFVVLST